MRILGIDPGIGRMGWGIIEKVQATKFKVLSFGCVETAKNTPTEDRLLIIYKKLLEIIKDNTPDVLAIEQLFFNKNVKTALTVGEARGIVLLTGKMKNLPISTYTPLQVKSAIIGYGRAEKNQVGYMVKVLLRLKEVPKPDDVSDALAVALTHAFFKKF